MKGWFCNSGLGPGPSAGTGKTGTKGFAGQASSSQKKALTTSSVPATAGISSRYLSR